MNEGVSDISAFQFCSSLKLVELTDRTAADVPELLRGIEEADQSTLFHHTHHFVFQQQFWIPEPTNDFAYFVRNVLQEVALGEQLEALDVFDFHLLEDLKSAVILILKEYLETDPPIRVAPRGLEFHFLKARTVVFPTGVQVATLPEFRNAIRRTSLASIYHHMFEARLRLERGMNDFSAWLKEALGEDRLANELRRLDPYSHSLPALRTEIVERIDRVLAGGGAS